MRMTTVTRMALPPGRLLSFEVGTSGEPGRQLPVSFDQRRHVSQGQRPGSWMAIAARLPITVGTNQLACAWQAVLARHGTFGTGFGWTPDGRLELHQIDLQPGEWKEEPIGEGQDPRQALRDLFDRCCQPFEQPSHRLALLIPHATQADRRAMVIIGSDHAHVDMWSFLVVLRDLFGCLDDLTAGRRPGADLPPVASFAEHSAALEARPSAPDEVHQRWSELLSAGGGVMPRFPLPLGDPAFDGDSVVVVRDILDAERTGAFEQKAAQLGVRAIGLALSVITTATKDLAGVPLRALFPVHSRDEARWRDSVGWYITNSVLECADPDPVACTAAVREAMTLGSYPLAPILAPYGGMPMAPGLFALSWLDSRRLPAVPPEADVQYVSAGLHDDGIMVWFIVNDSGLHLRARYPDTPEAMINVEDWLDTVQQGLRAVMR